MNDPVPSPAASPPDPDLSGRELGDYRVLRRLGRGAMAEVYLAEQSSLKRQVALKILRRSLAGDENYVRRFHNEAQAVAALVHANIVQIYEVGCIDEIHFIAQEYVQGVNLREQVSRDGPLEGKLSLNILRQTAAALQKSGEEGIVHRDIKPENIMLSSRGEVKVADFGLARIADDDSLNLTRVGITMGTPLYMSPEQVEGRRLDHRSDLYSLGVTAYHMLAGRPPFGGNTALNVAVQHLQTDPTPLATYRSDLPEEYCAIVHKMLAKQPDDRFQSAAELLSALRQLASSVTDEGWDAELANWSAAELAALPDPRFESTRQLATLMLDHATVAQPIVTPTWWYQVAAGIAASFAVGALLAWLTN